MLLISVSYLQDSMIVQDQSQSFLPVPGKLPPDVEPRNCLLVMI